MKSYFTNLFHAYGRFIARKPIVADYACQSALIASAFPASFIAGKVMNALPSHIRDSWLGAEIDIYGVPSMEAGFLLATGLIITAAALSVRHAHDRIIRRYAGAQHAPG